MYAILGCRPGRNRGAGGNKAQPSMARSGPCQLSNSAREQDSSSSSSSSSSSTTTTTTTAAAATTATMHSIPIAAGLSAWRSG